MANKYGNKKAVRNGITFDSQKEAARYDQLMLRLCAGEIRDLKLQPEFTLQEAFTTPLGECVRAIKYSHTTETDHFAVVKCSKCGHEAFAIALYVKDENFCPHCGAPMTDEAVQMVMERLEALKDGRV